MSFYKQIAVIVLFFTIQILFFIPNYNNLFIIILKGLASGGLVVILISYAFPSVSKSLKNKKNLDVDRIPQEEKDYKVIDNKYKNLLKQVQDGIASANHNYAISIYIMDQDSNNYILKSSSDSLFKTPINTQNNLLSKIISENKSKIFNKNENNDNSWDELIDKKDWKGSESLLSFPIRYEKNIIGVLILYIDHFSKINTQDQPIIESLVSIFNQGIIDIEESEQKLLIHTNSNKITDQYYSGSVYPFFINDSGSGASNRLRYESSGIGSASKFLGVETLNFLKSNNSDPSLSNKDKTELHITFFEGTKDFSAPGGSGSLNDERSISTFELDNNQSALDLGDECNAFLPTTHELILKGINQAANGTYYPDNRFLPRTNAVEDDI